MEQRTNYDLEMMQEVGYCSGIENYSRHMSDRKPGEPPFTLLYYFPEDFLIMIDESCDGAQDCAQCTMATSREKVRSSTMAFACRPRWITVRELDEFTERINQIIYVSAERRDPHESGGTTIVLGRSRSSARRGS